MAHAQLNGLRTLAALWLAFFNVAYIVKSMVSSEEAPLWHDDNFSFVTRAPGVIDLFFVMSGFLAAYRVLPMKDVRVALATRDKKSTKIGFFKSLQVATTSGLIDGTTSLVGSIARRLVRVVPGLVAIIAATALLRPTSIAQPDLDQAVLTAAFVNNFVPFGGFAGWTWTLAITMQFWVVFGVLVSIASKSSAPVKTLFRLVVGVLAALVVYRVATVKFLGVPCPTEFDQYCFATPHLDSEIAASTWSTHYGNTLMRFPAFFWGAIMAFLFKTTHFSLWIVAKKQEDHRGCTTIFAAAFLIFEIMMSNKSPWHHALVAIGAPLHAFSWAWLLFLVVSGAGKIGGWLKKVLSHGVFAVCARDSFAFSLVCPLVALQYFTVLPPSSLTWLSWLSSSVCIIVLSACVSHAFVAIVDEPIQKLLLKPSNKTIKAN